jgi:hypothetical protein
MRFGGDTETKDWLTWHTQVLKQEAVSAGKDGNTSSTRDSGNQWIKHCIDRLRLEKNWRDGKCSLTSLNLPKIDLQVPISPNPHIIFSNLWGTLVIIANSYFYYCLHGPKPKLHPLKNLVDDGSTDRIKSVTGLSNEDFLVVSILYNDDNFGKDSQKIFYWRVNKLEASQEPCILTHLDVAVQLNCLKGGWLLLQQSSNTDNPHSAYIMNLMLRIPIITKISANWCIYTIVNSTKNNCALYAGLFTEDRRLKVKMYSWDLLNASWIDVHSLSIHKRITAPTYTYTQGIYQSKLLCSDIAMIWKKLQKDIELYSYEQVTRRRVRLSTQPVNTESVFFIHNIHNTTVYYSGSFVGYIPAISIHNKQIIILNGTNLKLINLFTKQVIFDATVAGSLTHLGFVLGKYWVSQYPGNGFFTMNMAIQSRVNQIKDNEEGTAAVSTTALVRLSNDGRTMFIWSVQ